MANNNTNTNVFYNNYPSQVDEQSIPGQIIVQALPLTTGKPAKTSNSVNGHKEQSTLNVNKGKGNN
jgi:hypothetical protein